MKGREAQSQLGKTGAYGETDLAVVVLASACSPGSQPALRSARAIPRSRVACGAFNVEFTAIWILFGRFRAVNTRNARILKENYLDHRRRRIKRDLEAATKHIEVSCQSSISWAFPSAGPFRFETTQKTNKERPRIRVHTARTKKERRGRGGGAAILLEGGAERRRVPGCPSGALWPGTYDQIKVATRPTGNPTREL